MSKTYRDATRHQVNQGAFRKLVRLTRRGGEEALTDRAVVHATNQFKAMKKRTAKDLYR